MSTLPEGWALTQVGDIGEVRLGKMLDKAKNQGDPVKYLRNINVRWFRFDLSDLHTILVDPDERELLSVRDGDLFVCEGGEPGRCAVWRQGENDLVYQKALHRIRTASGIVPELLMYRLRHEAESGGLQEAFTGTTIKHLTRESLSRYKISLPPQNEQKRIASKLAALLTRVDACYKRLGRVPHILKLFRQSVLAAAMSGELTEDWPRNNEGWRTLPLGSTLTDIRYGTAQKSHYNIKNGTPVLRIPNIGDGLIDPSDLKFGVFSKKELDTLSLKAGDLLLIRSNGSLELVGKVALVEPKFEGYLYAGYLIRLRLNTSIVVPQFLRLFLSSPAIRRYIELTARSTSGVNNINTEEIRSIQLKLPSIEEQDEIVRRVEALFAYAARLEARYKSVRTRVEQLTPALLAKAFRGELVPQDPKDEPASMLLERIRAGHATAEGAEEITRAKRRTNLVKKPKARIIMLKRKDVEPSHLSAILKADGPLSAEALWSASQLDIDDFYDQLKDEEARGLLKENTGEQRLLEAA